MTIDHIEETEELIRKADRRAQRLLDVRTMIGFLETNPNVPIPFFGQMDAYSYNIDDIADIARAMKPCTKEVSGAFYIIVRDFGDTAALHVNFARDKVCERIVVGTEDIPEKIIEAHIRDIVEWVCPDTILGSDNQESG